jgi:hypothetical protein
MDNAALQELIALFLKINPNPTDDQFHALAASISLDHAVLESVAYQMLSEAENGNPSVAPVQASKDSPDESQLSEQQQVLDGDYDPNMTSPDDLMLNDGAPEGTSNIQQTQDALYDDGVGPDDTGVDIFGAKDAMISDGAPPVQLKAANRLVGV